MTTLDEAWAEAEAALPAGWRLAIQRDDDHFHVWHATAVSPEFFNGENDDEYVDGEAEHPTPALRLLAAALRAESVA